MDKRVRWIAFAVVLVVAALGLFLFAQNRLGRTAQSQVVANDCTVNPYWEKYRGLAPDWQQLVRQRDGLRVEFNPFTIVCDPATARREVGVQLLHENAKRESFRDGNITTEIPFNRERYRYLFDCAAQTYAILDRSIMGQGEQVAREIRMADPKAPEMRPIAPGGVAAVVAPPTCSTGKI